jgi:CDP-diacylglycerol--glycerol-3-phosphate 3-phosphatidyltransferase
MAVPGREQFRAALLQYVELPGARFLNSLGLTPNAITLLGFGVSVAGAYLVASGWLLAGGIVFLVGGTLDLFDGALARLTGKASPFGALLDSVFDRLGEAALFVGLGIYGLGADFTDSYLLFFVTILLLALIFSQGVSYLRARGEGLGVFTRSGLMTRPERVAILSIGLIVDALVGFPIMAWLLLAIAVVSCFTLFQRMFTIRGMLSKGG